MPRLAEKTNERPGTRAVLRNSHMSPYKAREVLGLIRNLPVGEALEVLRLCGRDAAIPIAKLLASAVANASYNDQLDPEELYVASAFCDEATTMKRWRPRARGRATRIRKRASHVTIVVARLPEEQISRIVTKRETIAAQRRSRRVSASRKSSEKQDSLADATLSEDVNDDNHPSDLAGGDGASNEALVSGDEEIDEALAGGDEEISEVNASADEEGNEQTSATSETKDEETSQEESSEGQTNDEEGDES